jgi:hypothetical protein
MEEGFLDDNQKRAAASQMLVIVAKGLVQTAGQTEDPRIIELRDHALRLVRDDNDVFSALLSMVPIGAPPKPTQQDLRQQRSEQVFADRQTLIAQQTQAKIQQNHLKQALIEAAIKEIQTRGQSTSNPPTGAIDTSPESGGRAESDVGT